MAKRVLVVSEYPYYRQLITVFLMALNYEVLVTSEVAAAALEASDERRAHVALVDVSRVRGARSSRSAPSQALATQVRAQLAEPSLVIAVYWDAASVDGFDAAIEKTETFDAIEGAVGEWFRRFGDSA